MGHWTACRPTARVSFISSDDGVWALVLGVLLRNLLRSDTWYQLHIKRPGLGDDDGA